MSGGQQREVPWTALSADLGGAEDCVYPRAPRSVCPQMPVVLRRAAINAASGAVRSHRTNHTAWEVVDSKRRGKEPRLPEPHPPLVAYQGMYVFGGTGLRKGFCRLKLLEGGVWRWMNLPVRLPPYALELFARFRGRTGSRAAVRTEGRNAARAPCEDGASSRNVER